MKLVKLILTICIFINAFAQAQSINRLTAQAVYLYSLTHLTSTTYSLIGLPEVKLKPGFYAGIAYTHQWKNRLIGGFEVGYQNKGFAQRDYINDRNISITYHYLSITPLIGISPLKGFDVLVGPQLNVLLSKSVRVGDNDKPVEFGLAGKLRYQYHRFGLTAGYFKNLTVFYRSGDYYLINQNWQVGLQYQLNRL